MKIAIKMIGIIFFVIFKNLLLQNIILKYRTPCMFTSEKLHNNMELWFYQKKKKTIVN